MPKGKVIKLNRSLEGLKQSERVLNKYVSMAFKDFGLLPIMADSSVFISKDKLLILALYIDDLLIFSPSLERIREFKIFLLTNFKVRDMGNAALILSINITRDRQNRRPSID